MEMNKDLIKLAKQMTKNLKKYEDRLKDLPQGTIYVRKINKKSYVYRNRKINGKVVSEYIGRLGEDRTKIEMKKSKIYKQNCKLIKEVKKNLESMSKEIDKSRKKNEEDLTKFAININKTDGLEPSKKAQTLLKLLELDIIDLETYESAIDRMYLNAIWWSLSFWWCWCSKK